MTRSCSYVICGTPRSGSTLLCEMLAATGVAGRPHSFYRQQDIAYWAGKWGMHPPHEIETRAFDEQYLTTMLREGSGGTGTFGIRIMWGSVAEATRRLDRVYGGTADVAERFDQAFGPTLFIHLSRLDKVAQAVSLARAEQSGLWHLAADGSVLEGAASPGSVSYDADRIADIVAELHRDDAAWDDFFATRHIAPLRFTYETMTADPQLALTDVLSGLGRDPDLAKSVAVPTAKMSDGISRDWVDRFRRENPRS